MTRRVSDFDDGQAKRVIPDSDPASSAASGPWLAPGRRSGGILVIAETTARGPVRLTLELFGLALRLKAEAGGALAAATFASDEAALNSELIALGADAVYGVTHPGLEAYHSEAWVSAATQLCRRVSPALVLVGHTAPGMDLAPRLAFRIGGAAAMGCTDVAWNDDGFRFTRPCHGGNVREVLSFATDTVVATLRPGYAEPAAYDEARRGHIERFTPALGSELERVTVVQRRDEKPEGLRLEDADVIVAGGRGLNGPEGFRVLEELAGELGGAVGASRVPCDLGWCPRAWQIGLTGRTVQPSLYIAVGISGAGHHMAGCGNAKTIVAVNTDPNAAIYRDARFGIVGDYQQFVPALLAAVRTLRAEHPK